MLKIFIPALRRWPEEPTAYDAFISYSHTFDDALGPSMRAALQRFGKVWYKRRSMRIFCDTDSLGATPALWTTIARKITESSYFILLASPEASESIWVKREIEHWIDHKDPEKIIVVLTRGSLVWDPDQNDFDLQKSPSLPRLLAGRITKEPLWVDMRWMQRNNGLSVNDERFQDNIASIAARILNVDKDTISGEDARQHQKRKATISFVVVAIIGMTIFASLSAYNAYTTNRTFDKIKSILTGEKGFGAGRPP